MGYSVEITPTKLLEGSRTIFHIRFMNFNALAMRFTDEINIINGVS